VHRIFNIIEAIHQKITRHEFYFEGHTIFATHQFYETLI